MNFESENNRQHFSIKVWAKLLPYLKPLRWRILFVVILMIVSALIDVAVPLFMSHAVDHFVTPRTTDGLGIYIVVYAAMLIVQTITTVLYSRSSMIIEMQIGRDMKRDCFVKLQQLSLSFYNQTPVGYILARVMSDTSRISGIIAWSAIHMLWNLFYVLGVFISMLVLNWKLGLMVMAMVPLIILLTVVFRKKLMDANHRVRSINSMITGAYNEGITGAKTSKTLVIEDKNCEAFRGITSDMYRAGLRSSMLNAFFLPTVTFISAMAVALVLMRGGALVMNGTLLYGTLAAFISYAIAILDPVQHVAGMFTEFVAAQVNIERVTALIDAECELTDSAEIEAEYGGIFDPKPENWPPIRGDIEFKNVWFRYPDGDEYVLEDFNLTIPAGTNVAIVGETGAGKSTLVNLACRFFEPTEGQILIDGVDYRERSQLWLHSNLGYVLQNPYLFSGSVADNIRYGKLDATDEEIRRAAQMVSADGVAEKLENGYDTDVGEGGDRLSTGEKQLISFARAIIADPRIFVLDEATSSIDTETELLIQNAISRVLKGRTSFIIAHRLSTIRHADLILVVSGGKIIERGTHEELMAAGGHYRALYEAMVIRENSEAEGFITSREE